jgi:hypothetical protein
MTPITVARKEVTVLENRLEKNGLPIMASINIILKHTPGPVASPARRLAQTKVLDQIQRRSCADIEFGSDHTGRDDRLSHDQVDEGGQPRRRAASFHLAQQPGAGGEPAAVIGEPLVGAGGERMEIEDDAVDLTRHQIPPPRRRSHADAETGEMGRRLAALAQHGGGDEASEPGSMLERLTGVPVIERDRRGERRWQRSGLFELAAPEVEVVVVVAVWIVEEGIARPVADFAGERRAGVGERAVEGSESVFQAVVVRRLGAPIEVGWVIARGRGKVLVLCKTALACPAAQLVDRVARQRPAGFLFSDLAAGDEVSLGADELVGRGAHRHFGIGQNEVFEMDEFAFQGEAGDGIEVIRAGNPTVSDGARFQGLVEAGEAILGLGQRCP